MRLIIALRKRLNRLGHDAHRVSERPRFKRLFVGGHLAYFVGHTLHLPAGEVVTGVLAIMVAVEFVATTGGGQDA